MRKGFFGICLTLVVAIVLIAAFVPGCAGTEKYGHILVEATLCGNPWPTDWQTEGKGEVWYTLTPASGSPFTGHEVPYPYGELPGTWTCSYDSGGPPGAYLDTITPSATQDLSAPGENITFTLNFELNQDARIWFQTWTIDGVPIGEWEGEKYYDTEERCWYVWVTYCNIIDAHYVQRVDGCEGYEVTLNETDELSIHYYSPEPGEPIGVYVANNTCAVVKEPSLGPIPEKLGQVPSYGGEPVNEGEYYLVPYCVNVTLDVETSWKLVKDIDHTTSVNWLHIGECYDPPCDWCSVFDLLAPGPGYGFELRSRASVELVGAVDAAPENNSTGWSAPLKIFLT
jgi:hypothetical protein